MDNITMDNGKLIMENEQLPKGWVVKKLGEVCEIYQPKTISKKMMIVDGKYPVFGANGIIGKYDKYNHKLSQLLVTCRGATCGSVNVSEPKSWINGNAMVIKPITEDLSFRFVEYFFRGYVNLSNIITGAAQPQITRQNLSPVEIPIPPLTQQKQLVKILDQAFTTIDKAKNNAQQNLLNAKQLFESYLQNVFSTKGEGWVEKTLGEVCENIFAGGDKPKEFSKFKTDKLNIPIYANAVKLRGLYGFTDIARVTKPSVTISARGSGTGHTELRKEHFLPIVRLIVVIPNSDLINLEFLKHIIDSLVIVRSGSAIPQLTVPMIKKYQISFPPLKEQQKIVKKLNALQAETKKLETIYEQKIADLEELKKSILQKAFSGQLLITNN